MINIRSLLPLSFQELNLTNVSFAQTQASFPSLQSQKPYNVSSCCYHYLLICIETFISLSVLVSIGSNRYKDGEDNDGNLGKFKGVEGFGDTQ